MASRTARRIDRTVLAIAFVFGLPPAVGVALATLRVTGGSSLLLAGFAGLVVGALTFGFVVLLSISGSVDPNI